MPENDERANEPHEHESALERTERSLYAPEHKDQTAKVRSRLHQVSQPPLPHEWHPESAMKRSTTFWRSPTSLLLSAGVIFFVAALLFFAYSLLTDRTVVSTENVAITVQGPVSIAAGEELSLQVLIQNDNPVPIEVADLIVEYPLGARRADQARTAIEKADRDFIGTLTPGQVVNRTIRTVLFGETDEEQEFTLTLEYRPQGSNAVLETTKLYSIPLSAAPVSLAIELPDTVSTNQDIEGTVRVRSNAQTTLEDVRVFIKYPPGFVFYDVVPQPSEGQNIFDLGDLRPGAERTIVFNGSILGQDNELKTFTVTVGEGDEGSAIAVPFNSALRTITMVRPSLAATFSINGDSGSDAAVLYSGQSVAGSLLITNNHTESVIDLSAAVRIAGEALDSASVQVSEGFFRSVDRTIVWDRTNADFTTTLEPGRSVELPFSFRLISPEARINLANARELTLDVSVNGRLATPDQRFADLSVVSSRQIKVASDLSVTGRAVRFTGPFTNTGPVPPKVNQPTTYTVLWAITNGTNDIRDAMVVAKLPPYAKVVGTPSPESELVRYDSAANEVTWEPGIIRAGTGVSRPVREVAFRVEIIPSAPQVNQVLDIIGEAILRGSDTFTNRTLESTTRALSTVLTTDPEFKEGM